MGAAAEKSHKNVLKLLLRKKANLEAKDKNGRTPLTRVAREGNVEMVEFLLEKKAEIEAKDNDG